MKKIGYTHGRFQPFHKGHLAVLLYVLENYDELWVGISNPLRRLPPNIDSFDMELKQSIEKARLESKNIFSFIERKEMIIESLKDEDVDLSRVKVNPHFGYYEEENWEDFLPKKEPTTIVLHSKDLHHDKKIEFYRKHGWKVEIIPLLKEGYSGTEFHKQYPDGDWEELVPNGTKRVVDKK
jgi:nicotinamide-nucleotide adenylyltransferase